MSRGEWKNSGEGECNLRSKTAGSEGFSGQNRQNCPSLNKKQNHNPKTPLAILKDFIGL